MRDDSERAPADPPESSPGPGADIPEPESAAELAHWSREDLIARLGSLEAAMRSEATPQDYRRMLYELQVHQIELEMQNREMRELRTRLEASRDLYVDLYDSAPVAYVTLNGEGLVLSSNLTAARLLGTDRESLGGKPLTGFLRPEDIQRFFAYLKGLLGAGEAGPLELGLGPRGRPPRTIMVEGVRAVSPEDGETLARLTLTDITESKGAEALQSRVNRALRALNAIQQTVRDAEDPEKLTEEVCEYLHREAGYALVWVGQPVEDAVEDSGTVRLLAASGKTDYVRETVGHIRWKAGPEGRGTFVRVVQTHRPVISNSLGTDPSFVPWREKALDHGLNAVAALPLLENGRILGVLGLYAEEAESFEDQELEWLYRVADELATAWVSLRHREQRRRAEEERDRLIQILEATPDFVAMATAEG
ncbi:MAG TPA: GAF domain-containing protein, partial [Gammaproteobacteria bacterium]|nr:GAF domain-containing protein [Gammaproteobacteria bacterium]